MPTDYEKRIAWARRRKQRIMALRGKGWSYAKIAATFRISATRVQQIVSGS